ncbi:MAG TPA: polysaccharide ABC transporter ATP-binding protein [Gemmatimonadaceae bacterium]|jgi:lipopolysaccharide transport system ATP-binding protein
MRTHGAGRVQFTRVWKKFRYGEVHNRLRDLIPAMLRQAIGQRPSPNALWEGEFWALRDVSFELGPGQALGIIGPNGAGKSTILRLLTRILRPTRGSCSARGRIGALIEVAAGFHPDLTGRENIYLQGAIMGMGQREITQKFDEIVAFSGVEWFLDTPVKRYSSGMHARLGFSIAAHFDPDVLIVDEVLSVGDAAFQRKAFARVTELVQRAIPVIVVSHQLDAIAAFCTEAMLLEAGSVVQRGTPLDCIAAYMQRSERVPASASGSAIALERLAIEPTDSAASGEDVTVSLHCSLRPDQPLGSEGVGVRLRSVESGLVMFETTTFHLHETLPNAGAFSVAWDLQLNVHPGMYVVEGFVWNNMSGREVGSALTAYVRVTGRGEFSGPVQMNPRIRVASALAST